MYLRPYAVLTILLLLLSACQTEPGTDPAGQTTTPQGDPVATNTALGDTFYEVDTQHSLLDFTARHIGFGRVRGTFNNWNAAAILPRGRLDDAYVEVTIQVGSIDTQNSGRDDLLQKQFFDAAAYPLIRFSSTEIDLDGNSGRMHGRLTIKDVTRDVTLDFDVVSLHALDQWENQRMVLESRLTIDRNDFGVVYADNDFWNGIVSDRIDIDLSIGFSEYNALNDVFPWRDSQVSTFIRDHVDSDGWDAVRAAVFEFNDDPDSPVRVSLGDLKRISTAFMQQGRHADAREAASLSVELLAAEPALDPALQADFHLVAAQNAIRAGADPGPHLRAARSSAPAHPLLLALERYARDSS